MLTASMEDYIEAIYQLSRERGTARVSEIAEALGVKPPSVSKALRNLAGRGLVDHRRYGQVQVTEAGMKLARKQVKCHETLTEFMENVLGMPHEIAQHDACQIEHAISTVTVERLTQFVKYLRETNPKMIAAFQSSQGRVGVRPDGSERAWVSKV